MSKRDGLRKFTASKRDGLRKFTAGLLVLGLAAWAAPSLAAKDYSFAEILALSGEGPAVREAEAGTAEAAARAKKEAGDFPDAVLGYSYMDLGAGPSGPTAEMAFHKFTLKQGLPVSGRLRAAGAAARLEAAMAQNNVLSLVRERRKRLATLVSSYHWGKEIVENRRRETAFLDKLFESAQAQYVGGLVNLSSLSELEIRRVQAETMTLELERENALKLLEIQGILGLKEEDFRLKDESFSLNFVFSKVKAEDLYLAYLKASPDRGSMNLEVERGIALTEAAKSSRYPDLDLMTEFDYRPAGGSTFGVGVEINLPLLSLGAKSAGIEAAEQANRGARERLARSDLEASSRIRALVLKADSQARQLDLLATRALKTGEENLSHMIQEFQLRKADLGKVFDAAVMTFELRNQYYGLADRLYADLFELEALTGERLYEK